MSSTSASRCIVCGKEFVPRNRHQRICSPECKKAQNRRTNAEWRRRQTSGEKYLRKCFVCGKEFETTKAHQITCSPRCSKKIATIRARAGKPIYRRQCKICGKEFETYYKNKLTCSLTCSIENHARIGRHGSRRRARCVKHTDKPAKPLKPAECKNCGRTFKRAFKNERFCSDDCRLEYFDLQRMIIWNEFFGGLR